MNSPATLTQTNNHRAWIKLMRDGAPLEARVIDMFAPPPPGARFAQVVAFAHARHMMLRKPVEESIAASFPKAPARRPRHRGKRDSDRN
jgi:cell wall assembly regulator SMI1